MPEDVVEQAEPQRILIDAVHPHWRGTLELSPQNKRVVMRTQELAGNFKLSRNRLEIAWDEGKTETFRRTDFGLVVHKSIRPTDIHRIVVAKIGGRPFRVKRIDVSLTPQIEVGVRANTSDIPTFEQVFVSREYDSENLPDRAATIVDLGGNVGYASIFFAMKYVDARILAVEPDAENFAELERNTSCFGDRIARLHAAAWVHDGTIHLRTENELGVSLDAWGVQVSETETTSHATVACHTIARLFEIGGFDSVDILKIDVEGAERELFAQGAEVWLARTNLVIIETHDRFCPGSDASVRSALAASFEELPPCGENLFFRRKER